MNHIKSKLRIITAIMLFILPLANCSFPSSYGIEKVQNIMVAGIDVEGDQIVLTTLVDTISESSKPGEEQIQYKLYVSKGATIFEAKRELHEYTEKRPSWYHTKYLLIGEEAAKQGIDRLLSFFIEDDETRLLFRLAVTKNSSAMDFLTLANTRAGSLADYLDALFAEKERTGVTREIHIINYILNTEVPWNDFYIPSIELNTNPVQSSEGGSRQNSSEEKPDYVFHLYGFAVFNKDKLVGYLGKEEALGLNFILNEVGSPNIPIKGKSGGNISLELIKSDAELKPSFDDMSVEIKINADSTLVEYSAGENPMNEQTIKYIEEQQNAYIKNAVEKSIAAMQKYHSDSARFGSLFYHKNPVEWENIKDNWEQEFVNLKVIVKVKSKIQNTYEILKPVGGED